MLEWLKRHAWKACSRLKRLTSSNLVLSATKHSKSKLAVRDRNRKRRTPTRWKSHFQRVGVLRLRQQPTKKWAVVLILSILSQGPLRQGAPRCGRPRGGQISSVKTDDFQPKVLIFNRLCYWQTFQRTSFIYCQGRLGPENLTNYWPIEIVLWLVFCQITLQKSRKGV